jgi:hypothetical protein
MRATKFILPAIIILSIAAILFFTLSSENEQITSTTGARITGDSFNEGQSFPLIYENISVKVMGVEEKTLRVFNENSPLLVDEDFYAIQLEISNLIPRIPEDYSSDNLKKFDFYLVGISGKRYEPLIVPIGSDLLTNSIVVSPSQTIQGSLMFENKEDYSHLVKVFESTEERISL